MISASATMRHAVYARAAAPQIRCHAHPDHLFYLARTASDVADPAETIIAARSARQVADR